MTTLKNTELSPARWNEEKEICELLDQRLLPYKFEYVEIKNYEEMSDAIRDMVLRGAPLIGIAAAYGMALAAKAGENLEKADEVLRGTRPTAVNLMWALDEVQATIANKNSSPQELYPEILNKAKWIHADDIERCKKMGEVGADYIEQRFKQQLAESGKLKIMTHCNAGALATGGYGTALGVIRSLHARGLVENVFTNETRPRQQGARLSAWELAHDQIPVTVVSDNMSAHLMSNNQVDLVVTGADRIASNGDAANKIGTYQLAICAKYHNVPFYMAAPVSSFDQSLENGRNIPIEERAAEEVSHINGKTCTVTEEIENFKDFRAAKFRNPAFDVTPKELIEQIFTEKGNYFN